MNTRTLLSPLTLIFFQTILCLPAVADGISWVKIPTTLSSEVLAVSVILFTTTVICLGIFAIKTKGNKLRGTFIIAAVILILAIPSLSLMFAEWSVVNPKEIYHGDSMMLLRKVPDLFSFTMSSLQLGVTTISLAGINDHFPYFHLFANYIFSVLIEGLVLFFGLSRDFSNKEKIFISIWLTTCTYPTVNILIPRLIDPQTSEYLYLFASEIFALVTECALFILVFAKPNTPRSLLAKYCFLISAANLLSFAVGQITHLNWSLQP